jgi:hypothetical protein
MNKPKTLSVKMKRNVVLGPELAEKYGKRFARTGEKLADVPRIVVRTWERRKVCEVIEVEKDEPKEPDKVTDHGKPRRR